MRSFVPAIIVAIVLIAAWQFLYSVTGFFAIGSPLATLERLSALVATASFWAHVRETFAAFGVALVLSVLGGVVVGVYLGLHKFSGDTFEPILVNLYSLPKVTLYPLVLLIFGLTMSARVAFGVMHAIVPIILLTRNAIKQIRPVYWRTARSLNMSYASSITHVVLPAILPDLLASIRIGFSLSLLGVIIAEMFASRRGLGFAAVNAMNLGDIDTIMAIGISLALFALLVNSMLVSMERFVRHRSAAQ